MANLSVRGLDPKVAQLLKKKASEQGLSVNAQVIEFVHQGLGLCSESIPRQIHTDLDHLAGTWSDEEASAVESRLEDFEVVDEDLWR